MKDVQFQLSNRVRAVLSGLARRGIDAYEDFAVLERNDVCRRVQAHEITMKLANFAIGYKHHADFRRQRGAAGTGQPGRKHPRALGKPLQISPVEPHPALAVRDENYGRNLIHAWTRNNQGAWQPAARPLL